MFYFTIFSILWYFLLTLKSLANKRPNDKMDVTETCELDGCISARWCSFALCSSLRFLQCLSLVIVVWGASRVTLPVATSPRLIFFHCIIARHADDDGFFMFALLFSVRWYTKWRLHSSTTWWSDFIYVILEFECKRIEQRRYLLVQK